MEERCRWCLWHILTMYGLLYLSKIDQPSEESELRNGDSYLSLFGSNGIAFPFLGSLWFLLRHWSDAQRQAPPMAAATKERRLLAVACTLMLCAGEFIHKRLSLGRCFNHPCLYRRIGSSSSFAATWNRPGISALPRATRPGFHRTHE